MDKQDATRDFTFAKLSDLTLPVTFRMQVFLSRRKLALWLGSSSGSFCLARSWRESGKSTHLLKCLIILNYDSLASSPSKYISSTANTSTRVFL